MTFVITAEKREETGRKTNALREEGKIPAVMYGFETEPTNITLDRNEIEKLYKNAGESSIIELTIGSDVHQVLIQDLQRNPLTEFITHADFLRLNMKEEVETSIPLALIGESPAVKTLGGTLIQSLDEIEVKTLPALLVREFEIDISSLATFDDVIRVEDIKIPEGMNVLTDNNRSIATVQPPRLQSDIDELNETPDADVSAVEVTTEKEEEEKGEIK